MNKLKIIDKNSEKNIKDEREFLSKLHHPFIVNMNCAFQDFENLYLVMDLLTGGDLRYHLCRINHFTEEETKFFISCILLGLDYIHKNNIIHRDIKPENMVCDERGYIRITDFGVAKLNKKNNSSEGSGTPGYMAPEIILRKNYSFCVDFFAIGVMGYEFIFGERPFKGKNRKDYKKSLLKNGVQINKEDVKGWSLESIDFINKCLKRKDVKRLGYNEGVKELKNHKWFNKYDWEGIANKKLDPPFVPKKEGNYDKKYCEMNIKEGEETLKRYQKYKEKNNIENIFIGYTYINSELIKEYINSDSINSTNTITKKSKHSKEIENSVDKNAKKNINFNKGRNINVNKINSPFGFRQTFFENIKRNDNKPIRLELINFDKILSSKNKNKNKNNNNNNNNNIRLMKNKNCFYSRNKLKLKKNNSLYNLKDGEINIFNNKSKNNPHNNESSLSILLSSNSLLNSNNTSKINKIFNKLNSIKNKTNIRSISIDNSNSNNKNNLSNDMNQIIRKSQNNFNINIYSRNIPSNESYRKKINKFCQNLSLKDLNSSIYSRNKNLGEKSKSNFKISFRLDSPELNSSKITPKFKNNDSKKYINNLIPISQITKEKGKNYFNLYFPELNKINNKKFHKVFNLNRLKKFEKISIGQLKQNLNNNKKGTKFFSKNNKNIKRSESALVLNHYD